AVGGSLALNYVGWRVDLGSLAQDALQTIDAVIGTTFGGTEQPLQTLAYLENSQLIATGNASFSANGTDQVNATVSNVANARDSGLALAKTTAADVIVASNRVSSTAKAYIDRTGTDLPTATPTVVVDGALAVTSTDDTGIFSNAKLVASGITTNDGGVHYLNHALDGSQSYDFTTDDATNPQPINFGQRVLISAGFDSPSATAGGRQANVVSVADGYVVALGGGYAVPALTSNDGFRVLSRGDFVQTDDAWTGGGSPATTYEYIGPSQRLDLGNANYADTTQWAPVGGTPGATYTYVGPAGASQDLNAQDYTDTANWQQTGGAAGTVYEWMGPDNTTLDLATQNYTDLGYWKPVPQTQLLPTGFNVSQSNSAVAGGIAVVNYIDNSTEAYIASTNVKAGSLTIGSDDGAVIEATNDSTFVSSGGSSINGTGVSNVKGATIATNVVLSKADAYLENAPLTTTAGDVDLSATDTSQIDATTHSAAQVGGNAVGIEMAFNTIGWQMTNLLFGSIDAVLGNSLLQVSQPAETQAYDDNSPISAAGAIALSAVDTAQINALVDNNATSAPAAIFGAAGMTAGGVLSSSMVNALVRTFVDVPYQYTTSSQPPALNPGDRVELTPTQIYRYAGTARGPPVGQTYIDLTDATQPY
ncbi:MAG: hypothetical protein ACRDTP_00750, partial [Mycobacteriales bacterium]